MKILLYNHQIKAVDFLRSRGFTGAIFADMGTGKTLMALEAFRWLKLANPAIKMVVCAPLSLLEAAWGADIRQFTEFTYYNAHDKPIPAVLREDILLINYDAVITKRAGSLATLVQGNLLVADESSRMKNNQAKTTKIMMMLGRLARYRVVMTGTPAPNSPMEYWGQIEFLAPRYLHKSGSFYAFRNNYFHLQRGKQIMHGQLVTRMVLYDAFQKGFKYEITTRNLEKLMAKISSLAFRIKKEECLDLPEQVDEIRYVYLGVKALRHYKEMKNDLITEIKREIITAEMALVKMMKLREITSGFIMDNTGKAIGISNEKIAELKNIIEELGTQPVIIWCCFKWEMHKIQDELEKLYGVESYVVLNSETKDRDKSINDFKEGRVRFAICHPASVAHGITWVNCSVEIFFSLDYSLERYLQAKARIHRIGQVNKCTYIHILAKGTIDEDVLEVLQGKGQMIEVVEKLLKGGVK
jgi:SNF2 family DNA or RNA helicase